MCSVCSRHFNSESLSKPHSWQLIHRIVISPAINKPQSISSAQVLRDLQKHFDPSSLFAPWVAAERAKRLAEARTNARRRRDKRPLHVKLGHGGTLDPLATGVLITGVGRGTKCLQRFLECTKSYEAILLFGVATDTYDRVGKIVARAKYEHVTRDSVEEALKKFRGKIMQQPPVYSALRVEGKKLYEYAREGKEIPVEIKKRPVEVLDLELVEWMDGGTHEHQWPSDEAEAEEKVVAEKLMHAADADPEEATKEEDSTAQDQALKRKRVDRRSDTPDVNPSISPKRTKLSPEPPHMSGALHTRGGSASPQGQQPSAENSHEDTESCKDAPENGTNSTEGSAERGPPAAKLRMTVTSGFYVRSLCHDLGIAVGSHGIMAELVRTRQGDFELGRNVLEYDDLAKGESVWEGKVKPMLDDWMQKEGWEAASRENSPSGHRPDSRDS